MGGSIVYVGGIIRLLKSMSCHTHLRGGPHVKDAWFQNHAIYVGEHSVYVVVDPGGCETWFGMERKEREGKQSFTKQSEAKEASKEASK